MLFKYIKMSLDQFAVLSDEAICTDKNIRFDNSFEFGFNREHRVLFCKTAVEGYSDDKPIFKILMTSYFEIAAESIVEITEDNGKVVFDPMTLVQFASLNYSSLRGALFIKSADTALRDIVLPPIYLNKIIKSAFIVD